MSILVVGAGPGVSRSVALRFAREGHGVGLLGSERGVLADLEAEVAALGVEVATAAADLTDTGPATEALDRLAAGLGGVDVLHFNPSAFREADPLELSVADLLADVALGVGGLLTAAQAVRPHLRSGGCVTVTGSMAADEPWHRAASLGVQKAGVRNLVRSLDATLEPDGIRAVSVTVRGSLAREGAFTPDRVAEAIWAASQQDRDAWRSEVPYSG